MLFAAARPACRSRGSWPSGTVETGDALLVTDQPDAPALRRGRPPRSTTPARRGMGGGGRRCGPPASATAASTPARWRGARRACWSPTWPRPGCTPPDAVLATDAGRAAGVVSLSSGRTGRWPRPAPPWATRPCTRASPFLQRAALTPPLRDAARDAALDVDRLREQVVAETGGEMPEIAEVRRVSLRDVVLMGLTVFAAYLLLGPAGRHRHRHHRRRAVADAEWGWVLAGPRAGAGCRWSPTPSPRGGGRDARCRWGRPRSCSRR